MKIYEFPYRFHRGIYLPLIPITLEQRESTYALADSGATVSLFESWVVERLGIEIESGRQRLLSGIGGRILAYEHKVRLRIADIEFPCKIAFSRELRVSLNLLGQDNFFDHLIVTFDKRKKVVQLCSQK
jgi:Aspartyl protease